MGDLVFEYILYKICTKNIKDNIFIKIVSKISFDIFSIVMDTHCL